MIKVDVIASFDNHNQEWFEINIPQEYLDNDKTIVNFLLRQLDNVSDLYKLSLCWICNEETVKNLEVLKTVLTITENIILLNGMLEECV